MHSVDDLYIIKVDRVLEEGHLGLGCRLVEASRGKTLVTAAVSRGTVHAIAVTASPAGHGPAPDSIVCIGIDRDADRVGRACFQLEVRICGRRILPEALTNGASLHTFSSLVAIRVTVTCRSRVRDVAS